MFKKNELYIDVIESINLLMSKEVCSVCHFFFIVFAHFFDTQGQKLSEEAVGKIVLRTFLSGTPQCKFGFNDSIQLREAGSKDGPTAAPPRGARKSVAIDDVTCHQCVKLHAFEKTREIQFVPPVKGGIFFFFFLLLNNKKDGTFELMNYRVTSNLKMPFTVSAIVNGVCVCVWFLFFLVW